MGESQTNATNMILYYLELLVYESILKRTVEKIQTNATNGMVRYLKQAILECIWKCTVDSKFALFGATGF